MKTYTLKSDGVLARYDYLSRLSPDRWAWEYLRRNKEFKRDAATRNVNDVSETKAPCADIWILRPTTTQTLAERWGLAFMPDLEQNGFDAEAVWSHYVFPDQVEVNCTPRKPGQSCNIWDQTVPHCRITHVTDRSAREYLLMRGKGCVVQIRCTGMSLLSVEPVRMKLQISDMQAYERKLRYQKEALKLYGDGPDTSEPLWSKTTQILRNGLIALDCLELGMKQRDIAAVIYGEDAVAHDWADDCSSLRSQLRYVIRKAEGLRDGGYLVELLGARLGPDTQAA
ncbi:MAG: DUF2285 domain-containing protein [Pseudomonadota bacterium]